MRNANKVDLTADETYIVESTIVLPNSAVIFNTCFQTTNARGALGTPITPCTLIRTMSHKDFAIGAFELDVVDSGRICDVRIDMADLHFESIHVVIANARQTPLPDSSP